jgi:PAS domain S-box-containing protein
MDSFLLPLMGLVSEAPGSLLYHFFMVGLFALPVARQLLLWQQEKKTDSRLTAGLGLLLGLQAGLALTTLGGAAGLFDPILILPPLNRLVTALTLLVWLWLMVLPRRQPLANLATAGIALALLAVGGLSGWAWGQDLARGAIFYNNSAQDTAWEITHLALLAIGLGLVGWRRDRGWPWTLGGLALLFAGHGLQYLYPAANAQLSGSERLFELVAFPCFLMWVYSQPSGAASRAVSQAAAALPLDSAELKTLQARLDRLEATLASPAAPPPTAPSPAAPCPSTPSTRASLTTHETAHPPGRTSAPAAGSSPKARQRQITYGATFLGLAVVWGLTFVLPAWHGSELIHAALEIMAAILALFTGTLALVRFYSKQTSIFLFFGIGFIGTGILDAYHTVISYPGFASHSPSTLLAFDAWSWLASRLFLLLFLWLNWLAWKHDERLGGPHGISERRVYLGAAVLTFTSCLAMGLLHVVPIGYPMLPILPRPLELITGVLFIGAMTGYLQKGHWARHDFEHWLVLSLITGSMVDLVMATSSEVNDVALLLAHGLKIISYLLALYGLMLSVYSTFRQAEESSTQLSLAMNEILKAESEREQTQAQLHKLSRAVEQSPSMVVITDLDGVIEYVNPKYTQITGYTPEEMLGKNLRIIENGLLPAAEYERVWQTITPGAEWRGEFENTKKNGERYWSAVAISPIRNQASAITHFLAVSEDITARRQAQAEMAQLNTQLETSLARAQELAVAAESANRAKSEFLANMSHEIRTPMNGVIGMVELALDTPLNNEQLDFLNTARESAHALLGLLNDILDFSKIEAGQLELETLDFNLRSVIEGVTDTLAPRATQKGLEMACLLHHEVPALLRGDPNRLRQVLINLAGNALKFTDHGEVVIRAELESQTDTQAAVRFSVSDSGIGIPKDRQAAIFERFTQADGSTTRKYGGTGLGLAISKQLVEKMGGQIGVTSEPGRGSTFFFTARFDKQAEQATPAPAADLRGIHVLGVDDNATNRLILTKTLEGFGCRVALAPNGQEALALLRSAASANDPFRLAVLDMQMPEMDGEELSEIIHRDPALQGITVIILTSLGYRSTAERLREIGCAAYLMKPIKQRQLFETLVTVLSERQPAAEPKAVVQAAPAAPTAAPASAKPASPILLAEDNPINRKLAITLLQKAGYTVEAVENGRLAVEAIQRTFYSLVLMDVQMPEMGGFEAAQRVRAQEQPGQHLPIIALTANAMSGDRERCLQAGMDDYLSKPLQPKKLFEVIERWARPLAATPAPTMPAARTPKPDATLAPKLEAAPPLVADRRPEAGWASDTESSPAMPWEAAVDAGSDWAASTESSPSLLPLTSAPTLGGNGFGPHTGLVDPPLDVESALPRFGGDMGFLVEMLQEFVPQLSEKLAELRAAHRAGDAGALERLAHNLKGLSASFSADRLTVISRQLETAGRTGDLAEAPTLIDQIEAQIPSIADYLRHLAPVET